MAVLKRIVPVIVVFAAFLLVLAIPTAFVTGSMLGLKPPPSLSIAAGRPGGGYYSFAEQYRAILARDGIELEIVETAGSMDNARMIANDEVDLALIQGGTPLAQESGIEALGAMFLEPFFIFHRNAVDSASDLSGWGDIRVAAGEPGSGTRIAINSAIEALDIPLDQDRLLPLAGQTAAEALQSGEVDVAVFVAPVSAPYLQPLLHDPDMRIETLRDPEALARRLTFVRAVDIPPAGLNYSERLPPERVELTAMAATLAARKDLHPALVNRMVWAAMEVHSGPSLLGKDLSFPSVDGTELPVNPEAAEIIENGAGTLDRILPYWMSAQITRVMVLLVPLLVLLIPMFRLLPGLYSWSMRSRVYRRYRDLVAIEAEASEKLSPHQRQELLQRLDSLDHEVRDLYVPIRHRASVYTLRVHIDLLRHLLTDSPEGGVKLERRPDLAGGI